MEKSRIITFHDVTTFPKAIETAIKEYLPVLRPYSREMKERTDDEIRCIFGFPSIFEGSSLSTLERLILNELSHHFLEGFHNTRVTNKQEILINGLKILAPDAYLSRMSRIFRDLDIGKERTEACMAEIQEYLDNKHGNRTNLLALFTPYRFCWGFEKYTKNIGGEICEFALFSTFPDI